MTDPVETRLYLLAPPRIDDPLAFAGIAAAVIDASGAACIRFGARDEAIAQRIAKALIPVCHERDVALLIVDHVDLVRPLGLDGVHLSMGNGMRAARKALGPDVSIGVSCGASRHAGLTAAEHGADYVSFDAAEEIDDLVNWWQEMIEVPCVIEGIMDTAQAGTAQAGRFGGRADFVMPPTDLWAVPDPAAQAGTFARALRQGGA